MRLRLVVDPRNRENMCDDCRGLMVERAAAGGQVAEKRRKPSGGRLW